MPQRLAVERVALVLLAVLVASAVAASNDTVWATAVLRLIEEHLFFASKNKRI